MLEQSCCLSNLSVCLSVGPVVDCGKTADWIRMPFGVVSGVSRGMGVLYRGPYTQVEGRFRESLTPIGLNGVFKCIFKTEMYLIRA